MVPHPMQRPSSRSSSNSQSSNSSLGIGTGAAATTANLLSFVKLRPEGVANDSAVSLAMSTYDCMVFVMYCKQHDRLAVSQVAPDIVWFPFVARDGRNWRKVASEGVATLLGRTEADGTVVRQPPTVEDYSSRMVDIVRLQLVSHRWTERVTQLLWFHKCDHTCEPVNNLVWVEVSELVDRCDAVFWGPEFRHFFDRCKDPNDLVSYVTVHEYNVNYIVRHITKHQSSTQIGCTPSEDTGDQLVSLFQSGNVSGALLLDLYEDYLNHSFPAYFMGWCNFDAYLQKLGYRVSVDGCPASKWIFNTCLRRPNRTRRASVQFLEFLDVCYAVVAMDPNTATDRPRARFLFDYFDQDGDGVLSRAEASRLIQDTGADIRPSQVVTFAHFLEAIAGAKLGAIESQCRLPRSALSSVGKLANKSTSQSASKPSCAIDKKFSRKKFLCPCCRAKKFEYGQHCVTIDTFGRSVDPYVILNPSDSILGPKSLAGKYRYSLECAFSTNSVGNVIFDFIRNRNFRLDSNAQNMQAFFDQFKVLCDSVAHLVQLEPKLLKRPSPAVVVGDLQGSLDSMFALERQLWRSVPIIGDELIFLGNYSGSAKQCAAGNQALEVLVYLFAIKYICPNKVVLLRGIQETRFFNQCSLRPVWHTRFGAELGEHVWQAVNSVFDHLPYMAVVNESIGCASSGIPREAVKHRLSSLFENLSTECAILHQVMTNVPHATRSRLPPVNRHSTTGLIHRSQPSSVDALFVPHPTVADAFTFGSTAFAKFLALNHFSYLIRSNECAGVADGVRLCFSQRCITVGSSVGVLNTTDAEAAVVCVRHCPTKLSLVRIPTSNTNAQQ